MVVLLMLMMMLMLWKSGPWADLGSRRVPVAAVGVDVVAAAAAVVVAVP